MRRAWSYMSDCTAPMHALARSVAMGSALWMVAFLLASCESETPSRMIAVDTAKVPSHLSIAPRVTFLDSQYVKAVLQADTAKIYDTKLMTYVNGNVIVEFFDKRTGKRASVLTAERAEINDQTRDMTAFGNVVIVSDSSRTRITTDSLTWNNARQLLLSAAPVLIVAPHETIQGIGFESDQYLRDYKIFNARGSSVPSALGVR